MAEILAIMSKGKRLLEKLGRRRQNNIMHFIEKVFECTNRIELSRTSIQWLALLKVVMRLFVQLQK
jgi:hypothetical protein